MLEQERLRELRAPDGGGPVAVRVGGEPELAGLVLERFLDLVFVQVLVLPF